jgi:hypothetical protein
MLLRLCYCYVYVVVLAHAAWGAHQSLELVGSEALLMSLWR